MQLVSKKVKGHKYWYAVKKGRRGGTVTNVKTIYLGSTTSMLRRLGINEDDANEHENYDAQFPKGFSSKEVGASTALWEIANALQIPKAIDDVCGERRADAAVPFGTLITVLAIQGAIAPPNRKSILQLRSWYESCRVMDLAKANPAGLDGRRVDEALEQLDARCIERLEDAIVARVVDREKIKLESLAFDATNFDSYASSTNPSRLLKRGHAKSKKSNLRVLGLGLLVTADDGIPLLSFSYPGNKADVTSFKSFLRRMKGRVKSLNLDSTATVACDGGNISREVVELLEKEKFRFVARLPTGHAPDADSIKTADLKRLRRAAGRSKMAAKAIKTNVYGKERNVIAVFSQSMKQSQIPGLKRDVAKAKDDLRGLQARLERQALGRGSRRHYLSCATTESRVKECLKRQHMTMLFVCKVYGPDIAPVLTWRFDDKIWEDLLDNRLGRTTVITNRCEWSNTKIVATLSEQSHAENAFRQMKDRQWTSALPLRCRNDGSLRIHNFISVLSFLLAAILRRRLRHKQIDISVDMLLDELSSLRYGYLQFATGDPGRLHALARTRHIPPSPTPLQRRIVRALNLKIELGPTLKSNKGA